MSAAPDTATDPTTTEAAESAAHSPTESARPDLRVVPDEPADPNAAEDAEVGPVPPWQYRLGGVIAAWHDQLPGLYTQRPAAWSERVDYALRGDWTTSMPESGAKRQIHLLGVLACLVVDAAVATPLRWCCEKPSRLGLVVLGWFLFGHLTN